MSLNISFLVKPHAKLVERVILKKRYRCSSPQLFMMGLPRSGTTLIYQYIVHRLNVAYFTHGVGSYPDAPCLTTYIQHKAYGRYQSTFKSNYGKESGAVAPREAGELWCRFFDLDGYVEADNLTKKDTLLLQNTIACVQNTFGGAAFINKNVKHLLRIEALQKTFPNGRFLIIDRDINDVAISILRGRYNNLPDVTQWWSVRPPDYNKLKELPVVEQIANQCLSLKHKMETDLLKIPPEKIIRICYEDFCSNPEELIRKIKHFLNVTETNNPVQQCFKASHANSQNKEENDLITLVGKLNNE